MTRQCARVMTAIQQCKDNIYMYILTYTSYILIILLYLNLWWQDAAYRSGISTIKHESYQHHRITPLSRPLRWSRAICSEYCGGHDMIGPHCGDACSVSLPVTVMHFNFAFPSTVFVPYVHLIEIKFVAHAL